MRGFASPGKQPADAAEQSDVKDGSPDQQPAGGEHAFDIAARTGLTAPASGSLFGSIVEDGAEPGPGQMRRAEFVAKAVPAIEAAATSELAPFGKTAKDCPYLEYYVRYYRDKPAAHLERMIAKYAQPEATDAASLLDAMLARVRKAIAIWAVTNRNVWADTGDLSAAVRAEGPAAMAKARLGAGRPLDSTVAARVGSAYGANFTGVRVHTEPQAARIAAEEGASAVSFGSDIAFAADRYRPNTPAGDALLAHELAHVEQQAGQSSPAPAPPATDDSAAEADADRAALGFLAPSYGGERRSGSGPRMTSPLALQRCTDSTHDASPQEAEDLKKELGISIFTVPEVGGPKTAYVGGQVQFGIDLPTPPNHKVQITSWGLDIPGNQGGFSTVPTGPTTMLPINHVGPHRFHVTIEVDDDVRFELEHKFEAILPVTKTDELLAQQQGLGLTEFQSQLALQKALLSPPGPDEQGKNAPLRIVTASPNPARQKDTSPDQLYYGIVDREPGTAPRYQWYLKPFRWDNLPATLGGRAKVKMDLGDAYDLGAGTTVTFPASHQGAFVVVCRATAADGKPRGDARYLQSILGAKEAEGVEKLVEHEKRVSELSSRFEGQTVPVVGAHVASQTRGETALRLYVGRAKGEPQKWLLIDMTLGLDPKQNELEYDSDSVSGVLDEFEDDNRYPLGAISLRIDDKNALGVPAMSRRFETDGKTFLNTLSTKAGLLSLILGLGAVLAAPFTGGGSIIVTLLIIGSAAAGATAGALSLIDHLKTEEVSKTAIALDILTIVTSFLNAGLAVKAMRGGPAVILASTGGRYLLWTNFALEGVSAILVGVEGAEQIIKIVGSDAPADEKMRLLVAVIANMILTGTLMVVSYGDIKATRSRLKTHLGGVADDLPDADRLTLALLDDQTLQTLKKSDARQLGRLADVLRDDPSALARLAGRSDLLDALKTARGNKAIDLEIAFHELRFQAAGLKPNPKLAELMAKSDTLKNVLAKRPEAMESLLKHPEAVDLVERAVAKAAVPTTTPAPAAKVTSPLSSSQLDLSKRVEASVPKGKATQPGFDPAKIKDKAYTDKFLDDMYKDAAVAQTELTKVTHEIAAASKGTAGAREKPKDRKRSEDKIGSKYGGDPSRLTDLAGSKITYKTLDDLYAGVAQVEKKLGGKVVSFEDRFITPTPSGYRDIQMNVKMSNGHVAEFRLHLEGIDVAADIEHAAYEVRRSIGPVAKDAGRAQNAAENALEQALGKEAQLLYEQALTKATAKTQ